MPSLAASSPHATGARVTAVALVSALACFPREDLSEYSRTWENQPAGAGGSAGARPDAGVDAGGGAGENPVRGDAGPTDAGPRDGVDAGGSEDGGAADAGVDAAVDAIDAGGNGEPDAAASLAASCAALDGTLQPGTRNCFSFSATPATWSDAVDACAGLGMQLVILRDAAEDDFVATLTPAAVWIGARDPAFFNFPAFANPAANAFSWLDGSVVADINWATGEPGATAGEFCVEKSNQAGGEPWFDRDCNLLLPFVCQQVL